MLYDAARHIRHGGPRGVPVTGQIHVHSGIFEVPDSSAAEFCSGKEFLETIESVSDMEWRLSKTSDGSVTVIPTSGAGCAWMSEKRSSIFDVSRFEIKLSRDRTTALY